MSCNRNVLTALLSTVALLTWTTMSQADDAVCQTSEGFLDKNLQTAQTESGISGTGAPQPDKIAQGETGISGTGEKIPTKVARIKGGDEDGKGIGGTGEVMQGAHITGTVTAFGSICVNGLRVSYDDTSKVRSASSQTLSTSDIKIGQVVDVRAIVQDNGATVHAQQIYLAPNAYGKIIKINRATGMLLVGSEPVLVTDLELLKKLHINDTVSVSGLPNEKNMLIASLIVKESDSQSPEPKTFDTLREPKLKSGTYVSFEGYIEKVGPDNQVTIDSRTYPVTTLECGDGPLKAGERVISMGRIQDDGSLLISGFAETEAPETKLEK